MTKSWTEEMINNFSSLSEDGGFLIRTSDYMPDLDAVEKFISNLLDKQRKELRDKVEGMEMPVPAPLTKKKYEAGSRIIGYNQAIKDILKELE